MKTWKRFEVSRLDIEKKSFEIFVFLIVRIFAFYKKWQMYIDRYAILQ